MTDSGRVQVIIDGPESDRLRRPVNLPAETVKFLRAWRAAQTELRLRAGEA